VKIRGFRIELGEIEAALNQHPSVQEVVVLASKDDTGDKRLVAYVVCRARQAPTLNELRRFLQGKLPDYMVPAAFVMLDALPRTPNGKINRLALATTNGERPALEATFIPPQTPIEQEIAKIWADILGLEHIGIHDNFFDLGGHSLRATQVIARLGKQFQIELPLRTMFEAPTVAGLAIVIVQMFAEQENDEEALQIMSE
jgi:acyl carrier protein